jgi:hypothetical protein
MKSNSAVPEHILLFGLYGSGKSNAWATIAKELRAAGSDAQFRVIGTEHGAMGRLSDGYPDFHKNVSWKDVRHWMELSDYTEEILSASVKDDWIIVEGGDKPWHWVQLLYDKLHGTPAEFDPRDPFAMEAGMPGDDTKRDWVKINGVYRNWINSILRSEAHVLFCNPQENIKLPDPNKAKGGWHDSKEVIEQYSRFGVRPAGQKELGHHFHSVIWMKNPRSGEWTMTTVDDHTREIMDGQPVNNFVLDYLVKVAKWSL